MSVGVFKKIVALEWQVLQRDGLSAEEAWQFYNSLSSYYKEYVKIQNNYWTDQLDGSSLACSNHQIALKLAESVERKVIRLQERLKKFIEPGDESITPIESKIKSSDQNKETDQSTGANNLNSSLRIQKFYIQIINSLVPDGELSSSEAELHFEHISYAYKKFISNQKVILTLINDTAFEDQLNFFSEVQLKVLSFQKTLKKLFSPNTETLSAESKLKMNEHFNRTDRQNVIVDFLDSLYKKQKSLIEQIELIELKKDLGTAEAETLHNHVSLLYESFVKNQAKIETYVSGSALDKELIISRKVNKKVVFLQTKLKEIYALAASSPSTKFKPTDKSVPEKDSDGTGFLNIIIFVMIISFITYYDAL